MSRIKDIRYRDARIKGYVLPIVMVIMSILTFTMLGVMETSQVEERKSRNEQERLLVEQVARSELDSQAKIVEGNIALMRQSRSTALSPTLYPGGCSSSDKEAICQSVSLDYIKAIPKPAELNTKVPQAKFTGRRFRIRSTAEHKVSGAQSQMSMELSYADLEIWLRRDIPEAMGTNPDRDELMDHLGFYIPEWWEVSVKSPWRFGCIAPGFNILSGILLVLNPWVGLAHTILSGNILWVARCRVEYKDVNGHTWKWESDDINPGDRRAFVVPEGSTDVRYYWRGYVPGRAGGHDGFWEWGVVKWWTLKQFDWKFPDPIDECRIAYHTSEDPKVDPCPFELLEDLEPVNDAENPGGGLKHGHWY